MHDLDRQQLEQNEQQRLLGEYAIGELTETQEMELASQFLEITSEAELEEFLGDLFKRATAAAGDAFAAAGRAYNSDLVQKSVIPALRSAARDFGPTAVGSVSNYLLPGTGALVAARAQQVADRRLADPMPTADQVLKEELEGLSGEDREFEIARRYIRFAIDALQRALQAPPRVPKPVAAEIAVSEAARTHVPGLVPFVPQLVREASSDAGSNGGADGGRWFRQGSSIVVELG